MNPIYQEHALQIITAEINSYQGQSRKIRLLCAIEIGKRLKDAKALLPHGEWGPWLEESVSYSQRTVSNLIRLSEEYTKLAGGLPNSQALANISDNMSVRKLQKAVKERGQVLHKNASLQQKLAASLQKLEETKKKASYLSLMATSDKLTFQYNLFYNLII